MPRVYTCARRLDADALDAFCVLQKGFTDQFVYYDKESGRHFMGLGRCIAFPSLSDFEFVNQGGEDIAPILFSFNRFDAENPAPADTLFSTFPRLRFMLPEVVIIEDERGRFLQVNSLGPVYEGRVDRFIRHAADAPRRMRETIPFTVDEGDPVAWAGQVAQAKEAFATGRIQKVVLSQQRRLHAEHPFSSKDLLVNLIDGDAVGTVFMYRYGDVFFCGCTPELLVRKQGNRVESMCLAGTIGAGQNEDERAALAQALMDDPKNRAEHEYVVEFLRQVMARNCYDVEIPTEPGIRALRHVQHLHTPVSARVLDGCTISDLASQLHPTPALAGSPVGEALMALRTIETYNRGFFGGAVGYVDGNGDGAFSVAIRSGVFDGEMGWLYAGCGVVEASVAEDEFAEVDMKLKTILSAFDGGQ
ncbi:MAG: isochorismate synthase [Coriobacteriia bacterium]|nr:isochorismate synthase [Coriobacteriia bacterium]